MAKKSEKEPKIETAVYHVAAVNIGTKPPTAKYDVVTVGMFTPEQWEILTSNGQIVEIEIAGELTDEQKRKSVDYIQRNNLRQ